MKRKLELKEMKIRSLLSKIKALNQRIAQEREEKVLMMKMRMMSLKVERKAEEENDYQINIYFINIFNKNFKISFVK